MTFQVIISSVSSHVKKKKKGKLFSINLIAKTRPAKWLVVLHYFLTNSEQEALNGKKIKQIVFTG